MRRGRVGQPDKNDIGCDSRVRPSSTLVHHDSNQHSALRCYVCAAGGPRTRETEHGSSNLTLWVLRNGHAGPTLPFLFFGGIAADSRGILIGRLRLALHPIASTPSPSRSWPTFGLTAGAIWRTGCDVDGRLCQQLATSTTQGDKPEDNQCDSYQHVGSSLVNWLPILVGRPFQLMLFLAFVWLLLANRIAAS